MSYTCPAITDQNAHFPKGNIRICPKSAKMISLSDPLIE